MTLEGFRVSGEKIKINLPLKGGTQPLEVGGGCSFWPIWPLRRINSNFYSFYLSQKLQDFVLLFW